VCVCVDEIISLSWFSEELKNNLSKNNWLCGIILILLVRESIFVGWGFPFPIVLVPRYKLSLCHTPIKPDLFDFLGIGVFAYGLRDHEITMFASQPIRPPIQIQTTIRPTLQTNQTMRPQLKNNQIWPRVKVRQEE
jgi:hypothetical protein